MITVLTFLFFYFLIYFLGRGISIIFKLKIKEIYDVPLNVLYPVLALFYIGNVTLLINFLFPIDTLVSLILITFPLLTNISKFSFDSLNFSIKKLTTFVFTPLIFGISSSDINLHYDAGLYHLNHQKWLQTEKIVFGLSNNHNRFGYSSIIEYINVNFWLDNNLILLHFTNLIFIVVFFQIVYLLLFTKNYKFSASLLVYGFFDNFGFNGGKNGFIEIESIAKQDIPFAIIFILSTYFIFQAFTSLEKNNKQILSIIFMLCLFSIQLRLLGFLNILFLIFVLIYKYKVARTFKIIFLENTFLVFIGFLFLIKNLITSSCLFYPISITCVNFLPWSNTKYANPITENNALADYHNAITRENYLNWFSDWTSQEVNFIVFKNVLLTFSIIIIFNLVIKFLNNNQINKKSSILLFYFIFSMFIWIITSPGVRFGIGIFLSFVLYISFLFASKKSNWINKNIVATTILYFIVIGLIPQINNYFSLLDNFFNTQIKNIEAPKIEYKVNNDGYGYLPEEGDQCWVNIECVRNTKVSKNKFLSYVVFNG